MAASALYQEAQASRQHRANQLDREDPCHRDPQRGQGVLVNLRDLGDQLGQEVQEGLRSAFPVQ